MTKNNSNWKTIEEEFIKEFDYLNNDYGADLQPILKFFKPYFQELGEKAWMYDQLNK